MNEPTNELTMYANGDIGVNHNYIVAPNGNAPLSGSTWVVRDNSRNWQWIGGKGSIGSFFVGITRIRLVQISICKGLLPGLEYR